MTDTANDAAIQRHNGQGVTTHAANGGDIIATYAAELGMDGPRFYNTLVNTIFPNGRATIEQVQALCLVAREYKLNPITRQIWAFPAQGGGIVPIVSVDGWFKMASSHPDCAGITCEVTMDEHGKPVSATAKVHRKSWDFPTEVTEYLSEVSRNTKPWKDQPNRMLRHRAIVQAIRIAFGIGGIYEPDEAARFATSVPVEHKELDSPTVAAMNKRIDAVDEPLEERKRTIEVKAKVQDDASRMSPVAEALDERLRAGGDAQPTLIDNSPDKGYDEQEDGPW